MRVKKGETRASLPDSHKGSPFSGEELVLFSLLAWAMFPSGGLNMSIPQNVDWVALIKEAVHQTVLPLAAEGMAALQGGAVPEDILRDARHAAFSAVLAHERMLYSQDQLLDLMRQADIPCVIIKGLSVASYYPKPELRLLGDIDLLVNLEDKDKACAVLARSEYVEQINPYEKDIGFIGHGALVELHYKMTNYPEGELGDALSEHMAPVVARAMEVNLGSYSFPALTGPDQAILLLDHMQRHIWGSGLGLRQICDWAMFVNSLADDVWEGEIAPVLRTYGLHRFAQIVTRACSLFLGLPSKKCAWCLEVDEELSRAFMLDIISSGNFGIKDRERLGSNLIDGARDGKPVRFSPMARLNDKARRHVPICRKYPALLPLVWIYLPFLYLSGRKKGKYAPIHISPSSIQRAKARADLYGRYRLFEPGSNDAK